MKKKKNIEQFFKEKFKNFEVTAPKNSWNRILRKFIKENKSDDNQDIERVFQEKFKDFEAIPPENSWTEIQRKLNKKNNSKNIERIFQEKFKDFEATPPENSWTEIQNRLKQKKNKKKTVIPLWARYSGIAAVLLIGFFVFRNNFDNPTIENSEIVDNLNENKSNIDNNHNTETNNQKDDFNNSVVDNSNSKNDNHKTEINNQKDDFNNSVVDNSNSKNDNHKTEINSQKDDFNNSVVDNSNSKNNNHKTEINSQKDDFNNSVVDNSNSKNNNHTTEINNQKDDFNNSVVDNSNSKNNNHTTEINNQKDDFNNSVVDNSNSKNNNHTTEINNQKDDFNNSVVDNSNSKNNNHNTETNNQKDDFNNSVVDNSEVKNEKTDDKNANKKDLLEEIKLAQQEYEQPILLTPNVFNKWRITPSAGAVTMNSLSKGSPISDKLTDNSKDYQTSMSYGLGLDYSLNKKLSIRTGINKLSTAYNTNDIVVYVSADRIEVLENAINVDPTTNKDVVVTAKRPLSTGGDSKTEGYINQKMGYIEIPVELSYKLLSSKFGIEIIGGISTLLLQENEVSVFSNNMKTTLGKANNLSDTHFSTNIGVGFRYEIFKSFDINLDPMFKYQLGTFEKSNGNFKPYLFGIYTGLSFKF